MSEASAAPTRPEERIVTLDIIRGFALLGIYVMNMPGMSTSFSAGADGADLWPAWWDMYAQYARDLLFNGKFNSLFSLLFAIGFTILLGRLEERDPEHALQIYIRRLLALFAIGIAHTCLLWTGDVLHIYALLGFLLLMLRRVPDKFIAALIVACLLFPGAMSLYRLETRTPADVQQLVQEGIEHTARDDATMGHGSYLDAVRENTRDLVDFYTNPSDLTFTIFFYVTVLTTMLLGLLAGRHRWIQRAPERLDIVKRVQWSALTLGIVCGAIYTIGVANSKPFEPSPLKILYSTCYALARISLMSFYAATIVRIAANMRWRHWLRPFAAAGRMPLTNYLMQSLIGTFLFYGWGLELWGKVGWALQLAMVFAIFFLIQVPLSFWWLRRHAYGPMEYFWRMLTYGRRPQAAIREVTV